MNPDKFARIAESLRQYRRAELRDFEDELGSRPLDTLYVDPLPNNAVLNSVLSSNTTYLLGRKGTGKSTVFSHAQNILRERNDVLSIYIDVKSLYDVLDLGETPREPDLTEVDEGVYRSHLLRKAFLGEVLAQLLKEVDSICNDLSIWDRWRGLKKPYTQIREKLSELQRRVEHATLDEHELPVLQRMSRSYRTKQQEESAQTLGLGAEATSSVAGPGGKIRASATDFDKTLDDAEIYEEYSDIVVRTFPFEEILQELQDLLTESNMKRLVVFFDDFSELKFIDQRLFVDIILSPLNNSSKDTIKLKIAGYPGRVYYGRIDSTKVDTLSLDFSSLYEASEVQSMEQSAIDYATRLLSARFSAFNEDIQQYFDKSVPLQEHMRLIFETTFNVPRLMGSLLHTCYLDRVSQGQPVTQASLRLAAQKYYENVLSQYFDRFTRFALEPYDNKLDRHNQYELLKHIISEARAVRRKIAEGSLGGSYFEKIRNPPTSHFVVSPSLTDVFQALESNFLLSKYKETRDKDGKAVTVYALYYGLIESERLAWGYPPGRYYRNYFVQRGFDFTGAIHEFLSQNQTIRCDSCNGSFPLDQRASFEMYNWLCPECREGTCSIVNLGQDFEKEVEQLQGDLMLEPVELEILNVLSEEREAMRAKKISSLIDVTYQLVGKRTSKLRDMGLVIKQSGTDNIVHSEITDRARSTYFST